MLEADEHQQKRFFKMWRPSFFLFPLLYKQKSFEFLRVSTDPRSPGRKRSNFYNLQISLPSLLGVAERHSGNDDAGYGMLKYSSSNSFLWGSEEDFTVKFNNKLNFGILTAEVVTSKNNWAGRKKVSTWSLKVSLLVARFKQKRSGSSSPLTPGRLGCLCAVIEGSSPSGGHTRGRQIERTRRRTGSGPEGSGPAETRSFDVEWELDLFFKKEKVSTLGAVWALVQSLQRVWTTPRVRPVLVSGVLSVLGILGEAPAMIMALEEQPILNKLVCCRGWGGKKSSYFQNAKNDVKNVLRMKAT